MYMYMHDKNCQRQYQHIQIDKNSKSEDHKLSHWYTTKENHSTTLKHGQNAKFCCMPCSLKKIK